MRYTFGAPGPVSKKDKIICLMLAVGSVGTAVAFSLIHELWILDAGIAAIVVVVLVIELCYPTERRKS